MDLFDKLNAGLEPLGGGLFVDAFVAARRSAAARLSAAPAARTPAASRPAAEPAPPSHPAAAAEPAAAQEAPPGLQAEVEAFLSRDQIEGTDDAEVQEFLKERSGFDPADLV